jgi:hypothetical protein
MIRSSKRSSLALLLAASTGCAGGGAAGFDTVNALPEEPRRAPGVAVDPNLEPPPAAADATTSEGLVVLKEPADPEAARDIVREFFRAVASASFEKLEPLIGEESWLQAGAMMGRQRARDFWRQRMSRLDYAALGGSPIYRDSEMETYRAADLGRMRPPRTLNVGVQGQDVIVRVPIVSPRAGKTRLFGDEILFVLRPDQGRYSIIEMSEDFQLP